MKSFEDEASGQKLGIWSGLRKATRETIVWNIPEINEFLSMYQNKKIEIIVEQVLEAGLIRALYVENKTWFYFMLKISGISPPSSSDSDTSNRARNFFEYRLLQREITLVLEGVWAKQYLLGSLVHPKGNIAVIMLKKGLVQLDKNTLSTLSQNKKEYEDAQT